MGTVLGIYIASKKKGGLHSIGEARLVPGWGIEGDRYFGKAGSFSAKDGPDRELTLIEAEAIEALARDYGVELDPSETRRNVVTRGVALNHLVGREFSIGEVRVRGIKLCEPCGHLAKLTRGARVKEGLVHRGGLRAQILTTGLVRPGDAIRVDVLTQR